MFRLHPRHPGSLINSATLALSSPLNIRLHLRRRLARSPLSPPRNLTPVSPLPSLCNLNPFGRTLVPWLRTSSIQEGCLSLSAPLSGNAVTGMHRDQMGRSSTQGQDRLRRERTEGKMLFQAWFVIQSLHATPGDRLAHNLVVDMSVQAHSLADFHMHHQLSQSTLFS